MSQSFCPEKIFQISSSNEIKELRDALENNEDFLNDSNAQILEGELQPILFPKSPNPILEFGEEEYNISNLNLPFLNKQDSIFSNQGVERDDNNPYEYRDYDLDDGHNDLL